MFLRERERERVFLREKETVRVRVYEREREREGVSKLFVVERSPQKTSEKIGAAIVCVSCDHGHIL